MPSARFPRLSRLCPAGMTRLPGFRGEGRRHALRPTLTPKPKCLCAKRAAGVAANGYLLRGVFVTPPA